MGTEFISEFYAVTINESTQEVTALKVNCQDGRLKIDSLGPQEDNFSPVPVTGISQSLLFIGAKLWLFNSWPDFNKYIHNQVLGKSEELNNLCLHDFGYVVALFITKNEALDCLDAANPKLIDDRWLRSTTEVIMTITFSHPHFCLVGIPEMAIIPNINSIVSNRPPAEIISA